MDPKQKQLQFETGKTPRKDEVEGATGGDGPPAEGLAAIMAELKTGFQVIDTKLDIMNSRLDVLTSRVESHDTRLDNAEQRISDLEDRQPTIQKRLERTEALLKQVAQRAEDLESRSRRCNIRLAGIAESTNNGRMAHFVEQVLTDVFGREAFSTTFAVERAHRTLGPQTAPGATPRDIVAKMLNFQDRDTILRLAREKGQLQYQGANTSLFPDFTKLVQEARRKYSGVKNTLLKINIKYSMMYPARLRVLVNGRPRIFDSPAEAEQFMNGFKHSADSSDQVANTASNP